MTSQPSFEGMIPNDVRAVLDGWREGDVHYYPLVAVSYTHLTLPTIA